jgi:hypothetical protein
VAIKSTVIVPSQIIGEDGEMFTIGAGRGTLAVVYFTISTSLEISVR